MRRARESAPGPGGSPGRNPRAAGTGSILDYTLGIVLGFLAVAGFIWITVVVARGELLPLDSAGLHWARAARTPRVLAAVLDITALGSAPTILLVLLLASALLATRRSSSRLDDDVSSSPASERRPRGRSGYGGASSSSSAGEVLLLWVAVVGGVVLNLILKSLFSRPRPLILTTIYAGNFAFPSGHAMSSMVAYGTLAYLIVRGASGNVVRVLSVVVAAVVIILIGLSRIYLGVHYATDVLGGYLIGFAWADLCILLHEARLGRRSIAHGSGTG